MPDPDYLKSLAGLAGLLVLDALTLALVALYFRHRRRS